MWVHDLVLDNPGHSLRVLRSHILLLASSEKQVMICT